MCVSVCEWVWVCVRERERNSLEWVEQNMAFLLYLKWKQWKKVCLSFFLNMDINSHLPFLPFKELAWACDRYVSYGNNDTKKYSPLFATLVSKVILEFCFLCSFTFCLQLNLSRSLSEARLLFSYYPLFHRKGTFWRKKRNSVFKKSFLCFCGLTKSLKRVPNKAGLWNPIQFQVAFGCCCCFWGFQSPNSKWAIQPEPLML